jgi:3-hydroxyisobutyrate dehydrogenase-like beta-hydroxyacid dehydrogenase
MGLAVARRLVESGFDVVGFDEDGALLVSELPAAVDLADLTRTVDVVVTVLPGPTEVDAAMAHILPSFSPGGLWIDLTSSDPRVAERLAGIAAAHGIGAVAAPMGGSPGDAEAGTLLLQVSGADDDVVRATPVLAALGTVELVGSGVGAAHTVKLLANLLWFGQVVAVSEALLLGTSLGVSATTLRNALARGAGGSRFVDSHLDALLDGDYLTTFGLDRCVEELETLRSLAAEHGTPFELSTLVTRLHEQTLAEFGAVDGELLAAKLLEKRAGRTLRR